MIGVVVCAAAIGPLDLVKGYERQRLVGLVRKDSGCKASEGGDGEFVVRMIQTYNLKWSTFDLWRRQLAPVIVAGVCNDETDLAVLGGAVSGSRQCL